eukprot:gene28001-34792_t
MPMPQMPNIPGAAVMTDTLDFVKNLWGSMGVVPGIAAPTLSVDELDKKINDLRAVEAWLNLNSSMVRGSIQALEVQRNTIATLKSMGKTLADAVQQQPGAAKEKSLFESIPYASAFFQHAAARASFSASTASKAAAGTGRLRTRRARRPVPPKRPARPCKGGRMAEQSTPAWRRADRSAAASTAASSARAAACASPEAVLSALLDSVEGGELHVRPLRALLDSGRFARFAEIGMALRRAFRDPVRRDYFLSRLKPHLRYVIGLLPASIQRHGMLPPEPAILPPDALQLEQVSDADLRQWLVDDGSLIYGEFQRYELENYFDAIAPYIAPGGQMMDLGSGLGKVVMSAALALPFARCTGVELLPY